MRHVRPVPWITILALCAAGPPAFADAPEACTIIADDANRLVCYDKLFRSTLPTDAPIPATDAFGSEQLPDDDKLRELVSTVVKISRRVHNEMVVQLENSQIWTQTSARHLNLREGDNVIIRRGRLGGYILTSERGGSTRVKRLR